jgi:hypothetical protein
MKKTASSARAAGVEHSRGGASPRCRQHHREQLRRRLHGTANSCASFSLANGAITSVTLAVSGTFTGTLTFEGTSDNSNWFTLSGTKLADGSSATTTTATGQFSFNNSGLLGVRARATAAMTGTAVVTAARGYAVARWLTPFLSAAYVTGNIQLTSSGQVGWTASATDPTGALDTVLCRGAANVIGIGGCTSSFPAIKRTSTVLEVKLADDSAYTDMNALGVFPTSARITGSAVTGVTVNGVGGVYTTVYKVVVASTAFTSAAVTSDVTIGTLPAKTQLLAVYADLTQTFACTATCTSSTLSFTLGSSAGGTDLLLTFDADAATTQRGLADADLGASLTRATAIQGGKLFSWTATTPVSLRLTSGTNAAGRRTA